MAFPSGRDGACGEELLKKADGFSLSFLLLFLFFFFFFFLSFFLFLWNRQPSSTLFTIKALLKGILHCYFISS